MGRCLRSYERRRESGRLPTVNFQVFTATCRRVPLKASGPIGPPAQAILAPHARASKGVLTL